MENVEIKPSELVNADVTIILSQEGTIINGTSGVRSGMNSELGNAVLGKMVLGK